MQLRMFNSLTLVILIITYYRVSQEFSLLFQVLVCIAMLLASIVETVSDD